MSSIDETKQFVPLNIAVLTISDTRSLADDKSGATLADRLTAAGHKLAAREIIVDDVDAIRSPCVDPDSVPHSPRRLPLRCHARRPSRLCRLHELHV